MRFLSVNIPDSKAVKIALTYVFGVGLSRAIKACDACGVNSNSRLSELNPGQIDSLSSYIKENFVFGADLRKLVFSSVRHLEDIGCRRGVRRRLKLPVRGQRTRTNSRTCKGRSRVPVAAKKS